MTDLFIDSFLKANPGENQRPALNWADGTLSYAELFQNIQRRVGWFSKQGLVPGDRVAICLPKGPNSVELILSGFQLGLIMVPIDPYSPAYRIVVICNDVEAAVLVTTEQLAAKLRDLELDESRKGPLQIVNPKSVDSSGPEENASPHAIKPDMAALILMTSGSTGKPKGITLSHGNISAFICWGVDTFGLDETDSFISIAPLHFDLSMMDIYACLLAGGRVYLPTENEISFPGNVANILKQQEISLIYAVPSFLQILLRYGVFERVELPALKQVLFAGEVFPSVALASLMKQLPSLVFANLYGPTETNVVTYYVVSSAPENGAAIPIGRACFHSNVSVLGPDSRQVPAGETGEICVTGPTVMLGYWGQKPQGGGAYKTGDFGYVGADGLIYLVGRKDHRVKVRGIRVDLPDIEQTALKSDQILHAVATLKSGGDLDASLTLHIIPKDSATFDKKALKSCLEKYLPRQVLPHNIKVHKQFPYTSNGKVDRQMLEKITAKEGR